MLKKKLTTILLTSYLVSGLLVFSQLIAAQPLAWNQHQGPYLEGNLGANLYYLGIVSSSSDTDTLKSGFYGFGWSGAFGYQFHPGGVAIEAGFMQNFVDVSKTLSSSTGDQTVTGSTTVYAPYLVARWEVPIKNRFAFIPKIGVTYVGIREVTLSTDQDSDTIFENAGLVLPFVGLGFSYAITPKIAMTLQYQGLVYGIVGAGLMSLGVDYHF